MAQEVSTEFIIATLLMLLKLRGASKSICPSEVAREIDPEHWRELMPRIRQCGWELADAGKLLVTQKGLPVERSVKGPLRFSQGVQFDEY